MYFQVIIVSAGALEPAGPRHLNTNTDLTNVSLCYFDYGIAGIFKSYRNKLSSITRSQDNSHLISPILHYEFSQLTAISLTYSLLFSYQCCITFVVLFWKVYMSGEAV